MARVEVDISSGRPIPGGEPHVHGTVRTADGRATEFQGWIGLLALLQDALTTADLEVDPS